jgi:hypothetical protein
MASSPRPRRSSLPDDTTKANLALAAVLLVAIAMNIWATVQTNQVRAQISNIFCIEGK